MIKLGVNIDHVATLRQARGTSYPSIIEAAKAAEAGGADLITIHLREDRRHIQDDDVFALSKTLTTRMNLEMAVSDEMLALACQVKPADVCLVPEKREELTTEGGLDVIGGFDRIKRACVQLAEAGCRVSLFIDPSLEQIEATHALGAPVIELHTGDYANASGADRQRTLDRIVLASQKAQSLGLQVNAGHGLTLENVGPIAAIPGMCELNIGHSIVARAVFVGLEEAVREMRQAIESSASSSSSV